MTEKPRTGAEKKDQTKYERFCEVFDFGDLQPEDVKHMIADINAPITISDKDNIKAKLLFVYQKKAVEGLRYIENIIEITETGDLLKIDKDTKKRLVFDILNYLSSLHAYQEGTGQKESKNTPRYAAIAAEIVQEIGEEIVEIDWASTYRRLSKTPGIPDRLKEMTEKKAQILESSKFRLTAHEQIIRHWPELEQRLSQSGIKSPKQRQAIKKGLETFLHSKELGRGILSDIKNGIGGGPINLLLMAIVLHDSQDKTSAFIQYIHFIGAGNLVQKGGSGLLKVGSWAAKYGENILEKKYGKRALKGIKNILEAAKRAPGKKLGAMVGSIGLVTYVLMNESVASKIVDAADWTTEQISDASIGGIVAKEFITLLDSPFSIGENFLRNFGVMETKGHEQMSFLKEYVANKNGYSFGSWSLNIGSGDDPIETWNQRIEASKEGSSNPQEQKIQDVWKIGELGEWTEYRAMHFMQKARTLKQKESQLTEMLRNFTDIKTGKPVLNKHESIGYYEQAVNNDEEQVNNSFIQLLEDNEGGSLSKVRDFFVRGPSDWGDMIQTGDEYDDEYKKMQDFWKEVRSMADDLAREVEVYKYLGVYNKRDWVDIPNKSEKEEEKLEEEMNSFPEGSLESRKRKKELEDMRNRRRSEYLKSVMINFTRRYELKHLLRGEGYEHSDKTTESIHRDDRGFFSKTWDSIVGNEEISELESENIELGLLAFGALKYQGIGKTNEILDSSYALISQNRTTERNELRAEQYESIDRQIIANSFHSQLQNVENLQEGVDHLHIQGDSYITTIHQQINQGEIPQDIKKHLSQANYQEMYDTTPYKRDKDGNIVYQRIGGSIKEGGADVPVMLPLRFNFPTLTATTQIFKPTKDKKDWHVEIRYTQQNISPYGHGGSPETQKVFREQMPFKEWLGKNYTIIGAKLPGSNKTIGEFLGENGEASFGEEERSTPGTRDHHTDPAYRAEDLSFHGEGTSTDEAIHLARIKTRLSSIKHGTDFKKITYNESKMTSKEVIIGRTDTTESIVMKRLDSVGVDDSNNKDLWYIYVDGEEMKLPRSSFDKALLMANLLLYTFAFGKSSEWEADTEDDTPFHVDGDTIEFNRNWNINNLTVIEDRLDYYEKNGLSKWEIVRNLNQFFQIRGKNMGIDVR